MTYGSPSTCFTQKPYELQVYPKKTYRLHIINTAAHATSWNSIGNHTLSVIETDDTPISSPAVNDLHRVKSQNVQPYSVPLRTDQGKPGDAFWMRGEMSVQCFAYIIKDSASTALVVLRYIEEPSLPHITPATHNLRTTQKWAEALGTSSSRRP